MLTNLIFFCLFPTPIGPFMDEVARLLPARHDFQEHL